MQYRERLKDNLLESFLIQRRLIIASIIVLLLLSTLVVRLYQLQVVEFRHFATLSTSNRVRIQAIPPNRGLIYDRNGVVMADNLPTYRLELVSEQIDDLDKTLQSLRQLIPISQRQVKRYRSAASRRRPFEPVPLKLNLSDEEVATIAVNLHQLNGVEINARPSRYYPLGAHAVHVLGYVGRMDEQDLNSVDAANYSGTSFIGKLGIEKYYEQQLHGKVGFQRVEINASGRTIRILEQSPPIQGDDLHLTIDARLQLLAEDLFKDESGALVAVDPSNGEILALVSMPSFDPNLFVHGISSKDYSQLRDAPNRPLFNRALAGQYPTGSTSKPFLGLAGLEYGVTSSNRKVFCPGYFQLPGDDHKYRDWKKIGHGQVNFDTAIVQSCDVYFYDLAFKLGIDRMSEFMQQFGFGSLTDIDSTGEQPGIMPSRKWKRENRGLPWFPGETLITGIGQGAMLATPLQLASATGALALQGSRYKPHLVHSIRQQEYPITQPVEIELATHYPIQKLLNWQNTVNSMEHVISNIRGTAHRISRGLQYKMAGKTGTAQVFGIAQDEEYEEDKIHKKLRDHALFIAFAPVEKPRIAVAVIVENGGHGSSVAAPIAREVIDAYLLDENPSDATQENSEQ